MTARDLISGALRLIGAIAPGEAPSAAEASDGLESLNSLIGSLSNEKLLIYTSTKESSVTLQVGIPFVKLGVGGDLVVNPISVDYVTVQDASNQEYPLKSISESEYSSIPNKSIASNYPDRFWDAGGYPLRFIYLYPTPAAAYRLNLYTSRELTEFATLDDVLSLPPGYGRMLRYNLAIDLASEYGKQVSAEIAKTASDSKANLKTTNFKPSYLRCDSAVVTPGVFDINVGRNR